MSSATFLAVGHWQTFTVPAGVTSVFIECSGGSSGVRLGARVTGTRTVTAGQVLYIGVGGRGQLNSGSTGGAGGWGNAGRGGDGRLGANGGDGGGGRSIVRVGSTTGTAVCVAAGAGGSSGDAIEGAGGRGGSTIGEDGFHGGPGSGATGAAQGGTNSQGGLGGTSVLGPQFAGAAAPTAPNAVGGQGGTPPVGTNGPGGGGGGGGHYSGGGGQAGGAGLAPGGGGGGGSDYTGGLSGATTNTRGGAGGGDGRIIITYYLHGEKRPPNPPTSVLPADDTATRQMSTVVVTGVLTSPNAGAVLRMVVRYNTTNNFSAYREIKSTTVPSGGTAHVNLPVTHDNQYFLHIWTEEIGTGLLSVTYNAARFFSNRSPSANPLTPSAGSTVPFPANGMFTWTFSDPDSGDAQRSFEVWLREDNGTDPGVHRIFTGGVSEYDEPAAYFNTNTFYLWQVRVADTEGLWGPFSDVIRFFYSGNTTPPTLLDPVNNEAVDNESGGITFTWKFRSPANGETQLKADFRYRIVGQDDSSWITILGDGTTPGTDTFWAFPTDTFAAGYNYEWSVRTYDTTLALSNWATPAPFWTIHTPGGQGDVIIPAFPIPQGSLGCGTYRVFLFDRGGQQRLGEITDITSGSWNRVRDDISTATLTVTGYSKDCGQLLAQARSMRHELVFYRDNQRVWEGPISGITYNADSVQFDAKDVMLYVYRRIMVQGYNDVSPRTQSVTYRATRIILNALAPDDPNVLPYLTTFSYPDDAPESRARQDYTNTAWEEVDDLAAVAGMDYTTVGRRIVLLDTHRPLGRLPMMRDGDFADPLIVSEYGMNLATRFAVTNGSGIWAYADAAPQNGYYGRVEMLASAYGDSGAAPDEALTPAAKAQLISTLQQQAQRNIAGRYPAPLVVRVPDNSTISPDSPVDINFLVPGVWIPLQATRTLRQVSQWQKLDKVAVNFTDAGETVGVTMSPAPNGGQDPDVDQAGEDV